MLRGILQAYRKIAPTLEPDGPERAALDRQVRHFSVELLAAEARAALDAGDAGAAADRLRQLVAIRGGVHLSAAAALLRAVPGAALRAYRWREAWRRGRSSRRAPAAVLHAAGGAR